MNNAERTLLELIKASLFSIPPHIPEDTDWTAVMNEAKSQAVLAIAAQSLPAEQYQLWARSVYRQIAGHIRTVHAEEDLIDLLDHAGIPVIILKGSAAALYYPVPSKRAMGDIDFIVPVEYFEQAAQRLKENGYRVRIAPEGGASREMSFIKNRIEYELHYRFSDDDIDIERYITQEWGNITIGSLEGHKFPMLPKLANGLVLLAHVGHHLKLGLGIRQIIDWMMYCHAGLDDAFWESDFKKACEDTHLLTLAVTVTRMCQKYLGLEESITWCRNADESLCDELMEALLYSGNFGHKNRTGTLIEKTAVNFKREGLLRYLQRAGEHNWAAYKKHPSLRPFCWAFQIFRYIRQGGKRGKKLFEDIERGKARYKLLAKLDLK